MTIKQASSREGLYIAESFVHVVELTQHCHKRKRPSLTIKLDFAKAFDTFNWDGLLKILEAKGFDTLWRQWILQLLHSSHSTVLVNGCPGP